MAEISGVKQALVQTQALERVQEAARRQGEQQQQSFAANLNRQVDAREHRVNEGERPHPEELDANARRKEDGEKEKEEEKARAEETELPPSREPEEEDRGRVIDTRA
jgi:hypothetical protein